MPGDEAEVVHIAPDADQQKKTSPPMRSVAAPTIATKSAADQVFSLFASFEKLAYQMPWTVLEWIELLGVYNPDMSQAIDNICTLSNSGHDLFVEGGSELRTRKIKELLEGKARTIQQQHGGIDGLIDKLLKQAATYGAICGEWLVNEQMTDLVDFADVNPKDIRFFWEDEHWAPYQKVSQKLAEDAKSRGQKVLNNCIKLNEATFHYYAFGAAPGSPYGVPPMLAALAPLGLQQDMTENMGKIVRKMGFISLVDMTIERLPQLAQETEEQYRVRAQHFLDQAAEQLEAMVREGGFTHFDDIEVASTNITSNAAGVTNIFKQNEEQAFSGLKSMPSLQGRSYSTTETYAGVAYDIVIRMTQKFQRAVKRIIESGYWMAATLAGEQPKSIEVRFHPNKSLNRLQDAQSAVLELKVALQKWVTGIIDQTGFAQELGYNAPVKLMESPPTSAIIGNTSPGGGSPNANNSTGTGTQPADRPPPSSDS